MKAYKVLRRVEGRLLSAIAGARGGNFSNLTALEYSETEAEDAKSAFDDIKNTRPLWQSQWAPMPLYCIPEGTLLSSRVTLTKKLMEAGPNTRRLVEVIE